MVWKIRSKTAFTFDKGTQRYVTGKFKILNMNNLQEMPTVLVKSDRFSKSELHITTETFPVLVSNFS